MSHRMQDCPTRARSPLCVRIYGIRKQYEAEWRRPWPANVSEEDA